MSVPLTISQAKAICLMPVAILFIAILIHNPIIIGEEVLIQNYFNCWRDNPYVLDVHDCTEMAVETEEYWETVRGYDCYWVRGDSKEGNTGHRWNLVKIGNDYHQFESTTLIFNDVSDNYDILWIETGYFVDGKKVNKSIQLDDWKKDFGDI